MVLKSQKICMLCTHSIFAYNLPPQTDETLLPHAQVNNNGRITFSDFPGVYSSRPYPLVNEYQTIAPFFGDVDTRGTGSLFYRLTDSDTTLLRQVDDLIHKLEVGSGFTSLSVTMATWSGVGYYNAMTDKVRCQSELQIMAFTYVHPWPLSPLPPPPFSTLPIPLPLHPSPFTFHPSPPPSPATPPPLPSTFSRYTSTPPLHLLPLHLHPSPPPSPATPPPLPSTFSRYTSTFSRYTSTPPLPSLLPLLRSTPSSVYWHQMASLYLPFSSTLTLSGSELLQVERQHRWGSTQVMESTPTPCQHHKQMLLLTSYPPVMWESQGHGCSKCQELS